jgi:UDP-GlcNAc:undecaprenyl-phosphate/decaprenyl-phosphate GlcNAc-1-phosphate transferase
MIVILFLVGASFGLAYVLTPLFERLFRKIKLIDVPDQKRKTHRAPIPRAGGVPVALSFALAFGILELFPQTKELVEVTRLVLMLLPAAFVIVLLGLLDDIRGLTPVQKLLGETIAAAVAYGAGIRILGIHGAWASSEWSPILTVVWLVGCANAVNLLDGLDGLAAGLGIFASLTMLLAGLIYGDTALSIATAPLVGALLAFLRYNFRPARIFLGDSGSLFVGFVVGCCGVLWSQKATALLSLTAPLMLMAIPFADTALAILRRFLRRNSIFTADRGHLHHRLLDRGFSTAQAVLILYAVSGIAATFSLAGTLATQRMAPLVLLLFCTCFGVGFWMAMSRLHYLEIRLAARLLAEGSFNRDNLNTRLSLEDFVEALGRAASLDECWLVIAQHAELFGFRFVQMQMLGATYEAHFGIPGKDCWSIRVPLSDSDSVMLCRGFETGSQEWAAFSFCNLLRSALPPKMAELGSREPLPATARGRAMSFGT